MRLKTGKVVSAKNDKTAVVLVRTRKMHPVLKKAFYVSRKFHAHDPENSAIEGDEVIISETRPLSKLKRWNLEKIVKKSDGEVEVREEILGEKSAEQIAVEKAERAAKKAEKITENSSEKNSDEKVAEENSKENSAEEGSDEKKSAEKFEEKVKKVSNEK